MSVVIFPVCSPRHNTFVYVYLQPCSCSSLVLWSPVGSRSSFSLSWLTFHSVWGGTQEEDTVGLVYSRLWKLGLNLLGTTELHRKLRSQGEPQKCLHISLPSFGRNNQKYSLGPCRLSASMVLSAPSSQLLFYPVDHKECVSNSQILISFL